MNDLDLYKLVLEEYRFQVKFNWDRTKFFLNLSLVIIGTTSTLLKLDQINVAIAVILFCVGGFVAYSGRQILLKGYEYYRDISLKKGWLEQKLGLQESAISSTQGQKEAQSYLGSREGWIKRKLRGGTVTSGISKVFMVITALNFLGVMQSLYWGFIGKVAWI